MKSYNCTIDGVKVAFELEKNGFYARYDKARATRNFDLVLSGISKAEDVGEEIEVLIERGVLKLENE